MRTLWAWPTSQLLTHYIIFLSSYMLDILLKSKIHQLTISSARWVPCHKMKLSLLNRAFLSWNCVCSLAVTNDCSVFQLFFNSSQNNLHNFSAWDFNANNGKDKVCKVETSSSKYKLFILSSSLAQKAGLVWLQGKELL